MGYIGKDTSWSRGSPSEAGANSAASLHGRFGGVNGLLRTAGSRAKKLVLAPLPPKLYWHLMGRFRAVPAVTSEYVTEEESLASGRKVVDLLQSVGAISPESVVLQIGSGIGRIENHLAAEVKFCFGADISPAMVENARRLVTHPNVEFRCTNGLDLDVWDDQSLDLVFSVFVFQHIPREQVARYLKQSLAKLRPGGRVVFQLMMDEEGTEKEPYHSHPYALRHYRREAVLETLANLGFSDARTVELNGAADQGKAKGDVVFVASKPFARSDE